MGRVVRAKRLIFLCGLAVLAWWIRYHPPGVDLVVFDDDARQHVYWTVQYQDPTLFQGDILTSFISSRVFAPAGYRAIYWVGVGVIMLDPLTFSQLLTLVLLLISMWLLDGFSKILTTDERGRVFVLGLFLFFSLYDASGGFPRTFAFPILLAFLLLLQRGAFRWASLIIVMGALLYPPMVLNTAALAGWRLMERFIPLVRKDWRRDSERGLSNGWKGGGEAGITRERFLSWFGDILILTAAISLTLLLLFSTYRGQGADVLGRQVTVEEARGMWEFHEGGRSAFFAESPLRYLLVGRSGIGAIHLIGFAIILFVMALVIGPRRILVPTLALHLTWTSLVLFGAAHLLLFRLHLPSRYTLYTLPLAFMLTIAANTGPFLDSVRSKCKGMRVKVFGGKVPIWVGWTTFGVLLSVYAYVQGHYICRFDTQVVAVGPLEREMLSFISTLSRDTLVAGHPMDMDNVPLLARRKVLANRELSLPYYVGYYGKVKQRLLDMLEAYYATDWKALEGFVHRYDVNAIVVRKAHFEERFTKGRIYLEPFNHLAKGRWREGERFILADPPRSFRCFENAEFIVLCMKIGPRDG